MTTRIAPHIELRDEERSQLTRWARGRRTPARLVLRAQIVLVAPEGRDTHDIAVLLGTSRQTVGRWRQRFAALELAEGKVLATCLPRHRHQEWLPFLRLIDQQTPQNQTLHLIEDNDATQKHPKVQRWVQRHRRFHMHFVPTSSSWLNLVVRFFRDLTTNRIRRGVFRSVPELVQALHDYIAQHHAAPQPFVWTATVHACMARVGRAQQALDKTRTA